MWRERSRRLLTQPAFQGPLPPASRPQTTERTRTRSRSLRRHLRAPTKPANLSDRAASPAFKRWDLVYAVTFPPRPRLLSNARSHPTPPNNINDRQNEPWNIRLLAARRQLYGEAKRWRLWRWVIVLGVAAAGLLASAFYEPASRWLGAVGGALLLVDWLVASPLETRRTKAAANIQEQFDTTVFGLPWKPIATGEKFTARR